MMISKWELSLIRLGGYTILFLDEHLSFYCVGENKLAGLSLSLAQVKEAVKEAECVVLMSEHDPTPIKEIENPIFTDQIASLFLAA